VSVRMLTNLRLADLHLTTAQQRSTGQNLPSDLYVTLLMHTSRDHMTITRNLMLEVRRFAVSTTDKKNHEINYQLNSDSAVLKYV
jgi:hypothetical protein